MGIAEQILDGNDQINRMRNEIRTIMQIVAWLTKSDTRLWAEVSSFSHDREECDLTLYSYGDLRGTRCQVPLFIFPQTRCWREWCQVQIRHSQKKIKNLQVANPLV